MATTPTVHLESLSDFVLRTEKDDSIFSLRDEAAAAKHTITFFRPLIEGRILSINKLLLAREKAPENFSKQENDLLAAHQANLLLISEQLNDALKKVAVIVKTATEIEEIKSHKIDASQLLFALRQIPRLIGEILESSIMDAVQSIDLSIQKYVDNKTYLEIVRDCDLLGKSCKIAVARKVSQTLDQINIRLEQVNVFRTESVAGSNNSGRLANDGAAAGVDENLVLDMLGTVPNGENSNVTGD